MIACSSCNWLQFKHVKKYKSPLSCRVVNIISTIYVLRCLMFLFPLPFWLIVLDTRTCLKPNLREVQQLPLGVLLLGIGEYWSRCEAGAGWSSWTGIFLSWSMTWTCSSLFKGVYSGLPKPNSWLNSVFKKGTQEKPSLSTVKVVFRQGSRCFFWHDGEVEAEAREWDGGGPTDVKT